MFKKILRGFMAAVTTPEAVKLEKSLGAIIAVRILIALGAGAGIVELVEQLAK